jgi:transposase
MINCTVIGIDLAKTKFHIAGLDEKNKVSFKKAITRQDFIDNLQTLFAPKQRFAFEACSGAHAIAKTLKDHGHKVICLKPKDVKPYAKSRQKNDINDAIAICRAALDPNLRHVQPKSEEEQVVCFLHKTRANVIQQRIQRSNSVMSSLQEFGYVVKCGKTRFAKECKEHVKEAYEKKAVGYDVYVELMQECEEILLLLLREKTLDQKIYEKNKNSQKAKILLTIPGIGPINASILSNKPMESYEIAKDFAASLGLVPRQNSTGGKITLGGISKQGDRYARTMLIQAGRSVVMRTCKANPPQDHLYNFVKRLKEKGKTFNVICVAVANKLAKIAYACVMKNENYKIA